MSAEDFFLPKRAVGGHFRPPLQSIFSRRRSSPRAHLRMEELIPRLAEAMRDLSHTKESAAAAARQVLSVTEHQGFQASCPRAPTAGAGAKLVTFSLTIKGCRRITRSLCSSARKPADHAGGDGRTFDHRDADRRAKLPRSRPIYSHAAGSRICSRSLGSGVRPRAISEARSSR